MAEAAKRCKIENCKRTYRAKGYCRIHYRKWRRGEYGNARHKNCSQEGCHKAMGKRGLCKEHYEAWEASRKKEVAVTGGGEAKTPAAPAAAEAPAEAAAEAPAEKKAE